MPGERMKQFLFYYPAPNSSLKAPSLLKGDLGTKKPAACGEIGFKYGRGSRTRTHNQRIWSPLLYQLSYTPVCVL